jgi:signal peptidase II
VPADWVAVRFPSLSLPAPRRLAVVVALIVLFDQLSKSWAVSALANGRTVDVVWTLRFALGFNSGIAFSQAQDFGAVVGIVAAIAVVFLARASLRASTVASAYGLALITAGAMGNVADRIFRGQGWLHGHVVDFIDFQWFPVFNIADSAITVGAGILIIGLSREYVDAKRREEQV